MDDLVLENASLRVSVPTSGGGGVLTVQSREGAGWEAGVDLDEFVGDPEDRLSRFMWSVQASADTVTLRTLWGAVLVEKRLTPLPEDRALQIEYALFNSGPLFMRPAFGLCAALPAGDSSTWCVPTPSGLREAAFALEPERRYLRPQEPWYGWRGRGRFQALLFPVGLLDAVEVRSQVPPSGHTLTAALYAVGLSPGCEAHFSCVLIHGLDGPEALADHAGLVREKLASGYRRGSGGRVEQTKEIREEMNLQTFSPSADALAAFRDRFERLSTGTGRRMNLLARLRRGGLTVDEALQKLVQP